MTELANEIVQAENRAQLHADSARHELENGHLQAATALALLAIDRRLEALAMHIEHASDEIVYALGAIG